MKRDLGQMMTLALGGICGVFALIAVLQSLGVGSGYRLLSDESSELDADLMKPMQQVAFNLPDFSQYIEISQRPLFSNDRKPRPIESKDASQVASDAPPPIPLDATLLGVLIDPDHQVAILRVNTSSAVVRVRQGMPLPDDLAGWTLQELSPRKAVFDGGPQQGSAELKLDMSKTPSGGPMPPPAVVPPPGQPGMAQAAQAAQPQQMPADEAARQAEVQRIIEQRRAQMRAEAEKMNQQQGKQ